LEGCSLATKTYVAFAFRNDLILFTSLANLKYAFCLLLVEPRPPADLLSLVDATGVERKRPTVGDVVVVEAGAGVNLGVVDQAAQSAQLGPERARGLGAARHQLALQRD